MIGLGSDKKNCVITQMQWKSCAIRPDPDSSSGCLHRKVFAAGKQTKVWGNHSDSTKGTKVRKSCLSVPRALDIAILIKCPKVPHFHISSVQNHKTQKEWLQVDSGLYLQMIKPLWQLENPDPDLDLSHWGVGRGVKSQLTEIVQGKERRADSLKVQASQRSGTSPNQDHWKCRQVRVPTRTRCNYKVTPGSQCKCNGSSHLHVDPKAKCKITSSFQCKGRVTF